jgi:hypothetical protein
MAVPSEDYSRQPPCSARFFGEGRQTEDAQQSKKKDYENENSKFRFRAQEPIRTTGWGKGRAAAD